MRGDSIGSECGRARRKLAVVGWTWAMAMVCGALTPPVASADHTAAVRLNAAPAGSSNLYALDQDQNTQLFSHSYAIPYSTLEPQLDKALKDALAAELGKHKWPLTADCPGYCGEVKLWVTASSKFKFTKTDQPKIEVVGPVTNNRLKVTLSTAARVRIDVKLKGVATDVPDTSVPLPVPPPHDEEVNHTLFANIDLPLKATAVVKLWPALAQESFSLVVDGKATISDDDGVKRELAQQGAQLGVLIGLSPGGLLSGGPIAWSITGFILGNEGGEMLQNMANQQIAAMVDKEIETQTQQLESMIKGKIDLAAQQGNDFLAQLMGSPVPGIGKTLDQVKSQMGFKPDVRLQMSGTDLRAIATARFAGTGTQKVAGVLQFPKTRCDKSAKSVAGGQIVTGVPKAINLDLAAQVGKPCSGLANTRTAGAARRQLRATRSASGSGVTASQVSTAPLTSTLGPIALTDQVYLGSVPPGTTMARWKSVANASLVGNLVDEGDYYECGFEAKGLATVAAIKLDDNDALDERLGDYGVSSARFLVASLGGGTPQAVFNNKLELIDAPQGIVFGGKGPDANVAICYMDVNIAEVASLGEQLLLAFDPEKCPQCIDKLRAPGAAVQNPALEQAAPARKAPARSVSPRTAPKTKLRTPTQQLR